MKREKLVHFKNTFYEAYQCELVITTNYDTLKIIYDTGLSAKGSCGFGMIECKYEKGILSL
ncbi:MAG: CRISPR-associated endoribonuclease Cas6 [Thomasclavelia sp.]